MLRGLKCAVVMILHACIGVMTMHDMGDINRKKIEAIMESSECVMCMQYQKLTNFNFTFFNCAECIPEV